eukprot:Gb_31531 [translate_table: standard]
MDSKQKGENLNVGSNTPKETTMESKQEVETVSALQDAIVKSEEEVEIIDIEDKEHSEGFVSKKPEDGTCVNSVKVIESLKEEVTSLKARIMELEGRLKVNEASVGISDDNDQPLFKVENEDVLHGNIPWDLSALPTECGGSTSSDTVLRNGVCDYQREGNLLCRPSKEGLVKHYTEQRGESGKHYTPYIKYTKLNLKVDTFFAIGSPLVVFLALCNVCIGTGNGQEYWKDEGITEEMPTYRQMLNIFHPYDPVAYKLESLVCKEHVDKRPIFIPYHKGGKRLHIGMQEFSKDLCTRSKAFMNQLKFVRARMKSKVSMLKAHVNGMIKKVEEMEQAKAIVEATLASITMGLSSKISTLRSSLVEFHSNIIEQYSLQVDSNTLFSFKHFTSKNLSPMIETTSLEGSTWVTDVIAISSFIKFYELNVSTNWLVIQRNKAEMLAEQAINLGEDTRHLEDRTPPPEVVAIVKEVAT